MVTEWLEGAKDIEFKLFSVVCVMFICSCMSVLLVCLREIGKYPPVNLCLVLDVRCLA